MVEIISRLNDLPLAAEDGATLNRDLSPYDGDGIMLACISRNVGELTSEAVSEVAMHISSVDVPNAKLGLYKFPDRREYSIDLVICVPESKRDIAVETARRLGQESVYVMSTGENIKTGESGRNPRHITPELMSVIANAISDGYAPSI
jgi:hypothetical protein